MRTRSLGPISPPPSSPPSAQAPPPTPPPTHKRSRRASTDPAPPTPPSILRPSTHSIKPDPDHPTGPSPDAASTPRHPKRVRFSDPSLTLSPSHSPDPLALPPSASTGLTPSLQRTRLLTPRHRRASLPPSSPTEEILHFSPLHSRLAPRQRRRLRRSHLSELLHAPGLTDVDTDAARAECAALRAAAAAKEDTIATLQWELESQRQLGLAVTGEEEARVRGLEAELARLRARLGAREAAAGPLAVLQGERERVMAWAREGASVTEADTVADTFEERAEGGDDDAVRRSLTFGDAVPFGAGGTAATADASTQASLDLASHAAEIELFERAVARLTGEAAAARKELDRMLEELKRLGLVHEDMASEDVSDVLGRVFRQARLELEYVLPGETASGFEDGRLLAVLVNHVRNLKGKLEERSRAAQGAEQRETAMRGQFNGTLARLQHLEARMTVVAAERQEIGRKLECNEALVRDLEAAGDARKGLLKQRQDQLDDLKAEMGKLRGQMERERGEMEEERQSNEKLKTALQSYRDEIVGLEALVTSMDDDACQLKEQLEKQEAETAALRDQKASAEQLLERHESREQDDARRIAELEASVGSAQTAIFEANERLDKEVKRHMNARATLDELQDDIDRANGKATKSKRDSGTLCW